MRKNVASQSIGIGMTSVLSGTDYVNSGAVIAYLTQDAGAIALGAVNNGICIPRSYGAHYYIAAQSETNFDHILFTFTASGAVTRHINVYTDRLGVPIGSDLSTDVQSIQIGVNSLYARVGAPTGASVSVDISSVQAGVAAITTNVGSVQTAVNSAAVQVGSNATAIGSLHTRVSSVQTGADSIYTRIGAPIGATLAVDVSSVQAGVNSLQPLPSAVTSLHTRVSSIQTGVDTLTLNVGSVQTGVNSLYARVGTPTGASLAVDVSSVQIGTNSLVTALSSLHTRVSSVQTGADNIYTRVGAPTGVSVSVDVASVQAGVTALTTNVGSVQTGVGSLMALVVGGRMTADITAVGSDANVATNLRRGILGVVIGSTTGDSTTDTLSTSNLTPSAAVAQQWIGRVLTFDRDTVTANLRGQAALVNSMTADGVLYVSSLTTAPASGNLFAIT